MATPYDFTKTEKNIVEGYLKIMETLQEQKEDKDNLSVNQVSWLNNTYDQIKVSLSNPADGSRQEEFFNKGEFLDFKECLVEIQTRIENSLI
jgi:hypothetical protein